MEEIRSIRREQVRAATGYRQAVRAEKQEGGAEVKQAAPRAGAAVDLKQLMGRVSRAEVKVQAARQSLQAGEAALTEVRDGLDQMEDLAQKASEEEQPDGEAMQKELSKLRQELMRILGGSAGTTGLLSAQGGSGQSGISKLPDWLLWGLADSPDPAELLKALGLDESASGSEIMSALAKLPLDDPGAGYLAAVYLGAVIAGGGTDQLDAAQAAQGLLKLLEAMENGASPDEALSDLTGGLFDSLEEFQQQFMDGLAPGMQSFFSGLLLGAGSALPDLMDLLANGSMGEVDLLMTLLAVLDSVGSLPEMGAGISADTAEGAQEPDTQQPLASREMGGVTVQGQEPLEAAYDDTTHTVTITGDKNIALSGQDAPALDLAGKGEVELDQASTPRVTVSDPQTQLRTRGETELRELRFGEKAEITLSSTGLTRIGSVKGGPDNVLRLKEGAFILKEQADELPVRVVIDGAVVLQAPRESHVFNAMGEELEPYDMMWKSMFPEWSSIEGMVIDGRHAEMLLMRNAQPDMARLWLLKGDPSQGYPAHLIALEGRDRAGELRTRYVYLQWSRMQRKFVQISMYPNPFTVTGGEEETDWRYEEDSRTLRILTGQVTGLTGGMGKDAEDRPFSGRLALSDGIGAAELTLDGVVCRVPSGRACSLGRGNRVTLLLKRGTDSLFESGAGCAGISLGDGTSLCIDQPRGPGQPDGSLTAKGGVASPGIGRDSGMGRVQTAPVMIRGGRVTAVEGRQTLAEKETPNSTLAGLRVSARALKLDAMDISTKEAARDAVRQLSAGRRWVNRLQEAYRAVYGKLEQSLNGLGSVRRYTKVVRSDEEVGALMWDMRQELVQSPMGAYSQWETDDVDQLLDAMESMINL